MAEPMVDYLREVLIRDLGTLKRELAAYSDETDLWRIPSGIRNSAGTLALHVTGNLRHFVGARLGDTEYVRDREAEFSRRNVPRDDLLAEIDRAVLDIRVGLDGLDAKRLAAFFPDPVGGVRVSTGDFLIHLAAHTGYHLGQVDYHRRLVTASASTVGAMTPSELASAEPVA